MYFKRKEVKWIGHAFCIKEAEDLIQIKKPDVVLLEIMLKEESGFDLLKNIKKTTQILLF